MHAVRKRIPQVPVVAVSNASGSGIETLASGLEKGKTYCMLGSSGVGKSTLINNLSGNRLMETGQISASTQKGRHITSHRELFLLDQGGILIDNPGMREVGITDSAGGLDRTFGAILELSGQCRYTDCTHMTEAGCAVIEALDRGELDPLAYENYVKMEREKEHFEATVAERRKKDRDFGKMVKNFKKGRNHNNY
jgi:ribosome biogenesis GTPase